MMGKRVLKMMPSDLGRLYIEDSAKTVGTVALALWTQDMLVRQGIYYSSQHHQDHLAVVILMHCHFSVGT